MKRAVVGAGEGREASIRQVAAASLVGSVVEWYDFFLYGTMAALVFNSEFFPTFDPLTGTLAAFTTFAAGFVTRPLGGVVFGHLGDRLGRKPMLVVTMMIMGLSTFAMGLLPSYDAIGVAAPLLLVLLRMFQGIGLGGEWGGAVLLCVEHAPDDRRGWYSSWPQLGVPIGLLLSTAAVKALGPLGDDALVAWAWRLPFLASIVLVAVGLFVRLRIAEPPAFAELVESDARARVPLLEVVRRHPKVTLLAMGARISESVTFNVYNAFLVTYVVTVLGLENTVALNALLVAAVDRLLRHPAGRPRLRPHRTAPRLHGRRGDRRRDRLPDLRAARHRRGRPDHRRGRDRLGVRRVHHVRRRGRAVRRAVPDPGPLQRHVHRLPARRAALRRGRPDHLHPADRALRRRRPGRSRRTSWRWPRSRWCRWRSCPRPSAATCARTRPRPTSRPPSG